MGRLPEPAGGAFHGRVELKAILCAVLVLAGVVLLGAPLSAQTEAEDSGQGPQILTSDLARRQTVEKETLTASFLFVDEQPIVDIRINGDPQKFTQDTSVIISKQFDNRKEQQVIEVVATNLSGKTRQKSFLVLNPTAVRRFGESVPKYYRIEDRWDTKWGATAVKRAGAAVTALGSMIYMVGGQSIVRYDYDSNQVLSKDPAAYVDSAERYDLNLAVGDKAAGGPGAARTDVPGRSELVPDAPKMASPVSGASLNQKLYVFESRAKVHEFDPKEKRWRTLESPIRLNRVGPAVAAANSRIYLFGGLFGVQTPGNAPRVTPSLQLWEFNPESGAFAIKRSVPTARGGATACMVKGIIYVFGGFDGDRYLDAAEAYSPATDSWTKVTPMPTPRAFSACVVVNDLIYVIGGRNKGLFGERVVGVMEMFDPATGIWRDRRAVPTARSDLAAVAIEGVIYVIGGSEGSRPLSIVEAYR